MTCPICKAETQGKYRPFCSRKCADLDLGRWMTGAYAIPSEEPLDDEFAEGDATSGLTGPRH